jgi:hypothetical protein
MTRDDIITLGKQAGFTDGDFASFTDLIVHFGTLVSQHEREACAYVAEQSFNRALDGYEIADAIRARGQE